MRSLHRDTALSISAKRRLSFSVIVFLSFFCLFSGFFFLFNLFYPDFVFYFIFFQSKPQTVRYFLLFYRVPDLTVNFFPFSDFLFHFPISLPFFSFLLLPTYLSQFFSFSDYLNYHDHLFLASIATPHSRNSITVRGTFFRTVPLKDMI